MRDIGISAAFSSAYADDSPPDWFDSLAVCCAYGGSEQEEMPKAVAASIDFHQSQ